MRLPHGSGYRLHVETANEYSGNCEQRNHHWVATTSVYCALNNNPTGTIPTTKFSSAHCLSLSFSTPLTLSRCIDMEPSTIQSAILQPISLGILPETESGTPLFLPRDAPRRWYLGFLEHWEDFQRHARQRWDSESCKRAFHGIKDHKLHEPPSAPPTAGEKCEGSAKFEDHFRREVLEVVETIFNKILATATMKQADGYKPPDHLSLRKAASDRNTKPRFWYRAKPADRGRESRLCGHMEYLGGKPGALTWAVEHAAKNS
jgi:hypothetical protein